MLIRLLPPTSGPQSVSPITVNGRTFDPKAATYQDIISFDADELEANGWTRAGEVGATSARPVAAGTSQQPLRGRVFIDTTANKTVQHDGVTWRDVLTGSPA